MKILRSWLKDYINFDKSDEELADLLTFSGTLVEEVEKEISDELIVAKIKSIKKHPNADKLSLAEVETGEEILNIVCGAPNLEVGQIVPLAKVGAKFGDFEIKEVEIRGEKSQGMLCSEKELGLGDDHSGIMILPADYKIGEKLNKYLGGDAVFDLEITPNRGDCLSHLGIAREISVLLNKALKKDDDKIKVKDTDKLEIDILNPAGCNRYCGILINDVKIEESPVWLKERLEKTGVKPINNVVDITNYIMLDLGQPLHAFDAKKLKSNKIIVRNATDNEQITTIDGETRTLSKDMLVIADENSPIAVAGVMGGQDCEIDQNTTSIVLESAEFDRKLIRKTSKDLKLATEASYRFERGIDPEAVEQAADKAAKMIEKLCEGKITAKVFNVADEYENEWVKFPIDKINNLLGLTLTAEQAQNILLSLGFLFKNGMTKAPSWRHDIGIWQDLAEEVSRIYGFANIPSVPIEKTTVKEKSDYYLKEYIKDLLAEDGFVEVYTYSFLSEKDIVAAKIESSDLLEVANPVQPENKYLRKSLIPGLLKTVSKNPAFDQVPVFEIGNVFTKTIEKTNLAIAASGKQSEKLIEKAVKSINSKLGLKVDKYLSYSELKRDELERFKIKKPVTYVLEVEIDKLLKNATINKNRISLTHPRKKVFYRSISKYPSITRDLAFIVDKKIEAEEMINLAYSQSELIIRVELFDEFSSDKFGVGKKNVAFHIDLQHQERTLNDKEADEVIKNTAQAMEKKFKAKLRTY